MIVLLLPTTYYVTAHTLLPPIVYSFHMCIGPQFHLLALSVRYTCNHGVLHVGFLLLLCVIYVRSRSARCPLVVRSLPAFCPLPCPLYVCSVSLCVCSISALCLRGVSAPNSLSVCSRPVGAANWAFSALCPLLAHLGVRSLSAKYTRLCKDKQGYPRINKVTQGYPRLPKG